MAWRKYRTAICAIAKDEDDYLLEWAAYHLAIGFEHIWLYDNASRVSPAAQFRSWQARRRITVVDWPSTPGEDTQLAAYAHFLRQNKRRVDWVAVIDLDEFICLKQDATIGAFLSRFADADAIALNWRFFGSADRTEHTPGLLMERFTRASEMDNPINQGVKSISRTVGLGLLTSHHSEHFAGTRMMASSGRRVEHGWAVPADPANFAVAQVNHYFVKSREEWRRKVARGYTWHVDDRTEAFDAYDRNECEDRTILTHKAATERWMKRLGPSPATALTNPLAMLRRLF